MKVDREDKPVAQMTKATEALTQVQIVEEIRRQHLVAANTVDRYEQSTAPWQSYYW